MYQGVDENNNIVYKDQNGDGIIGNSDRVVLGNYQPKFTYGFASALNWKNLDASITFAAAQATSSSTHWATTSSMPTTPTTC